MTGAALTFAAAPMIPDEQGNLTLTPAHIKPNVFYGPTIEINGMPTLKTISWAPGEDFSALESVVLTNNPELHTITDSGSLPLSLRILILMNLPKLDAVPSLTNLTSLQELCLQGTPLVPTISIPTTLEPISITLLEVPLVTTLSFAANQKVRTIYLL